MSYAVKEIFYTLQGEGANAGARRSSAALRGAISGRDERLIAAAAICRFCDTDFAAYEWAGRRQVRLGRGVGGGRRAEVAACSLPTQRFVVCTGGEPLLQLDAALIAALHEHGFQIAVETNGTIAALTAIDWVCVSPKAGAELVQRTGDELKLVYPQQGTEPERFELLSFRHFFLQPMDGTEREVNIGLALAYCLGHPQWRLSLQTHKILGIP